MIVWRLLKSVFSGQLLRETINLLKVRKLEGNLIVFYCSGWVDEIFVRSSITACIENNLNVILIVSDGESKFCGKKANYKYFSLNARFLKYTKASILVSASTGINPEYIPKSCYEVVHMPHSLVSMNMVYAPSAFDAFTRFFLCGEYQADELRELDLLRGRNVRPFNLVGYGKSDVILQNHNKIPVDNGLVLIAPSWGPEGFIEKLGMSTISALLDSNFSVCLRPHPRYMKHSRHLIDDIIGRFFQNENFHIEDPFTISEAMLRADIVISDYSGAAFEYIFTRQRPVIFVDIALKIMNPLFNSCNNTPIEISWRESLGVVVTPSPQEIVSETLKLRHNIDKYKFSIDSHLNEISWDGRCGFRVAEQLSFLLKLKT